MTASVKPAAVRTSSVRTAAGVCVEVIGWTFTVAVVGLVIASFLLMARGYRMVAVTSGSMRPTYEVGDAVLVRPGKPENVRVGDIVVFSRGDHTQMTIHRVIGSYEVYERGLHYRTKGDANTDPDEQPLHPDEIQAKGFDRIPHAGRIAHALSADTGRIALIVLLALTTGREVVTIVRLRRRIKQRAAAQPPTTTESESTMDELMDVSHDIPQARTEKTRDHTRTQ